MNLNTGDTQAIIALCHDAGIDRRATAYVLASASHETGGKMKPVAENLNYSVQGLLNTFSRARISEQDAKRLGRIDGRQAANQQGIANAVYGGEWGRANLGNTKPNDGWDYRGRGLAQITGRRNYEHASYKIGVDIVNKPDAVLSGDVSARILVRGMIEGWFTGKKLSDYINPSVTDYKGARRIINGQDRAQDVADLAVRYEAALPNSKPSTKPAPKTTDGFWAKLFAAIFGGKK